MCVKEFALRSIADGLLTEDSMMVWERLRAKDIARAVALMEKIWPNSCSGDYGVDPPSTIADPTRVWPEASGYRYR
jgi:hypothetical protein